MNELSTTAKQLPDNLEDLSKFTLIGREKLNAVRAEIRAIEKVGLAKEVHEQKLQEAQEIAEAVLDAEAKIGELTSKMETSQGQRTDIKPTDSTVPKSKAQQLEQIGITEKQKQRFETLARHPETVEKAKADARAEGRIVTRQDVLNRIVVPAPRKNPVKEVVENAKKEHEAFRDAKVVNIKDIEKDKLNVEITTNETYLKIQKGAKAASDLCLLNIKDVEELARTLSREEKDRLINSLMLANKTLMRIMADLED